MEKYNFLKKVNIGKIHDIMFSIIYSLSFLFGFGFLGLTEIWLLLLLIIILVRKFFLNDIRIHFGFFLIVGFSVSYFLCSILNYGMSIQKIAYCLFFPILCYVLGSSLATGRQDEKNKKEFLNVLFYISLGMILRVFSGWIITVYEFGAFQDKRYFIDIWNSNNVSFTTSATGVMFYLMLYLAISIPLIVDNIKNKRIFKAAALIMGVFFSLYLSINLKTRSYIVVLLLLFLFYCIILICHDFKKYKKNLRRVAFVFIIFSIVFLLMMSLSKSFYNTVINNSFIQRFIFDLSNIDRIENYIIFFNNCFKYPFGGMLGNLDITMSASGIKFAYVHNAFLDLWAEAGIITFIMFLLIYVSLIKNSILHSILSKDFLFSQIVNLTIAMFTIMCLIEPIFQGNIYFSIIIFIVYGFIEHRTFEEKSKIVLKNDFKKINGNSYRIVFLSNFLSMHQKGMHEAFVKKYGDRYHFISFENINKEHQIYNSKNNEKSVNEIIYNECEERALLLIDDADIILYGNIPFKIKKRIMKKGKLIFQCCERPYKTSYFHRWNIKRLLSFFVRYAPFEKYNSFCLCYSAYTAYEFSLINHANNRCYDWGYWPINSNINKSFNEIYSLKNEDKIEIMFVNRLIDLKHPEKIIYLAKYLLSKNINFHISVYGDGNLKEDINGLIIQNSLEECIDLKGTWDNEYIQQSMMKANIVISTSDRNEGYGVTIYEGMMNACAVVTSHYIGASFMRINNGVDGFIYNFNDDNDLCKKVEILCNNSKLRKLISENAFYKTINQYDCDELIDRFHNTILGILDGKRFIYTEGPMSIQQELSEYDFEYSLIDKNDKHLYEYINIKSFNDFLEKIARFIYEVEYFK